jgi:hypothetical protein
MPKKNCGFFCKFAAFVPYFGEGGTMDPTTSLEFQNSEVARPHKKKSCKPRQHRPYKSVSATSLETRIADLTKKMLLFESKMEALRDKLKQHNNELTLRETTPVAPA